jgi:hypothetical protein
MRRSNFLTIAFVALATFITLSVFVGRRHWGGPRGWRYDRSYYEDSGRCDEGNANDKPARKEQTLNDSTDRQ